MAVFEAATGGFDLVRVGGDRIVTGGLHDDRRQARHVAVHRGDAGQPRIGGPDIARRPFGAHRRKDQGIAQYRSHLVDVDGEVGPGADQAERGREGDAAIAQRHGECQREPATGRITGNDGGFRVESVLEQPGVDRDHFLEGDRILSFRCAGVVGDQCRHSGRGGEVRDQAAVALGAAQGVGAAVQVDQCPVGCSLRWLHPLDGDARDGDALVAGALRGAGRGGEQCRASGAAHRHPDGGTRTVVASLAARPGSHSY